MSDRQASSLTPRHLSWLLIAVVTAGLGPMDAELPLDGARQ